MTNRPTRSSDGLYHIKGKTYKQIRGSRARVWHWAAFKTEGGLERDELLKNSRGEIVSKKKHNQSKRKSNLTLSGKYKLATKGTGFGPNKTRKSRGGNKKMGGETDPTIITLDMFHDTHETDYGDGYYPLVTNPGKMAAKTEKFSLTPDNLSWLQIYDKKMKSRAIKGLDGNTGTQLLEVLNNKADIHSAINIYSYNGSRIHPKEK